MRGFCKKTFFNKIKESKGILFHFIGLASLIWFLIRVVPAPHRSQYPCQQVGIPIAFAYIAFWSTLLHGFFHWVKKMKTKTMAATPALISVFIILCSITGIAFATTFFEQPISAASWDPIPKNPIGEPRGVHPGRVVWVWNPEATESNLSGFWWKEENINQSVIDQMFSRGLQQLTGTNCDTMAWDTLFRYFNNDRGRGNQSYQPGEKIAIKINLNNCGSPVDLLSGYLKKDNDRDACPYVVKALLRQLIYRLGVQQEDVTVYDASRVIADWFYPRVADEFPQVHYVDAKGKALGREKVQPSSEKIYFHDGTIRTLPLCVVNADYLINIPILKKHPINNGVTLAGKNMFGTFIESVRELHPYHISGQIMGNPAPQTDLLAHEHIGRKTVLYIGDGLFGTVQDHRTIAKFKMYPFNDDWTNSLFFSQDPVALDSVMYDFLHMEGPCPIEGAQNYLHQAAEPPAGVYDPERDGVYLLESLGVHEHWDPTVSIFSKDRYSGYENQGIDFVPLGEEFAQPSVMIMQPDEHKFYIHGQEKSLKIFWKTMYSFPDTFVIGNITVKARVNNVDDVVDEIRFYVDGELRYTDENPPYEWEWHEFSWSYHVLMVAACVNQGEYELRAYRGLWKIL